MLRVALEVGIVCGSAWWGYVTGGGGWLGILLGFLAAAIVFGIWGAVDFHQAGKYAEALRLVEELVISGLVAWGLVLIAQLGWGLSLLALSIVYHAAVYAVGERLLKPRGQDESKARQSQLPV
ncbi:MAG: DUF2568 domain-containing protein [Micrococcales bacterium]|nr:DUF2568 domain-containing protein [Micrococcales bacterium]